VIASVEYEKYCVPPGADGGRYGSGCFHLSNNFSVSLKSICMLNQLMLYNRSSHTYPLLSRLKDVSVGIKERANVDSLASPQVALHSPVKS
jgi:hypothetical protein